MEVHTDNIFGSPFRGQSASPSGRGAFGGQGGDLVSFLPSPEKPSGVLSRGHNHPKIHLVLLSVNL